MTIITYLLITSPLWVIGGLFSIAGLFALFAPETPEPQQQIGNPCVFDGFGGWM